MQLFLKNGATSILVDTGARWDLKRLMKTFIQTGIGPTQTGLIILTHTHNDHTGNLRGLVKLTKAKVLAHKNESGNLKKGFSAIPTGQGTYPGFISKWGESYSQNIHRQNLLLPI